LEKLKEGLTKLKSTHEVCFDELFNVRFMTKYTEFVTIEDMFGASEFQLESNEDFDLIPEEELDEFVRSHTRFSNWREMLDKAGEEYVFRKLGFDE
jgi:hypothetical protein